MYWEVQREIHTNRHALVPKYIQSSDKEESIGVKCNDTSAIYGLREEEMLHYFI